MATLKDVARMSGVSTATVSYVINDGPRPVAPATRARVLDVISQLNYRPSAAARGLKGKRTDTIGIIFPMFIGSPLHNEYFEPVLSGILEVGAERQSSALIFTGLYWDHANDHFDMYTDGRCDGLILFGPPNDSTLVNKIVSGGTPLVVVGSVVNGSSVITVDVDNTKGAYLATRHLLELGHRHIVHLLGMPDRSCSLDRAEGFRMAHAEFGLPFSEQQIVGTGDDLHEAYHAAFTVLNVAPSVRPTAVVAFDDRLALDTLNAAKALGISVPEELSIVGFNDCAFVSKTEPPFTTVRQPLREIGRSAANLLLDLVHRLDVPIANVVLDAELILRRSTSPPSIAPT